MDAIVEGPNFEYATETREVISWSRDFFQVDLCPTIASTKSASLLSLGLFSNTVDTHVSLYVQ